MLTWRFCSNLIKVKLIFFPFSHSDQQQTGYHFVDNDLGYKLYKRKKLTPLKVRTTMYILTDEYIAVMANL